MKPDTQAADVVTAERITEYFKRGPTDGAFTAWVAEGHAMLRALSGLPAEVARLRERTTSYENLRIRFGRACEKITSLETQIAERDDRISRLRGELAEAQSLIQKAAAYMRSEEDDKAYGVLRAKSEAIDAALKDQQP